MPETDTAEALRLLHEQHMPYASLPTDAGLTELDKKLSSPVGVARLAYEALVAFESAPKLVPGQGMTPRAFDIAVRRHERKRNLNLFKRALFPLIQVYVEQMEAQPDLGERNSMAATVLLGILFTDDWRHVTKLLAQLQSIFGHANMTLTTKRAPGSVEERIKLITARALDTARSRVILLSEVTDAKDEPGAPVTVPADQRPPADGEDGAGAAGDPGGG